MEFRDQILDITDSLPYLISWTKHSVIWNCAGSW